MDLVFNRLNPNGTVAFSATTPGTASPAPAVTFLKVGGDSSANLHGAFLLAGSQTNQPIGQGVYCYDYAGNPEGASAQNLTSTLASTDFLWPTPDNGLALFQRLTAPVNPGCGTLAVPSTGGWVLGKFTGGGTCTWTELLALPTAAVQQSNFRVGADGSLNAMVVYSGTINFGGGALTSSGTNALAIAKFNSAGTLSWTKNFTGAGSSFTLGSLSVNSAGTMVVTGRYAGSVNLGGGALPASSDTFLAVFNSGGTLQWSKTVTVGDQGGLMAAAGPCGLVLATNSPSVNLGTGALSVAHSGMPASIGVAALGL
jgi:hypothetical protein